MKKANYLFELIHSLNQGEKKFFRLYTSRHTIGGQNNYLKLFDAISAQKWYDEKKIKEQFKKERFVKQLAVTKNYLQKLILDSLEDYYAQSSSARRVDSMVNQADILLKKGFLKQCGKLLSKAKKQAVQHELPRQMLAIADVEINLHHHISLADRRASTIKMMESQVELALKQLSNNWEYRLLTNKIGFHYLRYGLSRSKKELDEYRKLSEHPLLQDESKALTFQARYFYFGSRAVYFSLQHRHEETYNYYRKLIDLIRSSPDSITENKADFAARYIGHLYNMLSISVGTGKTDSFFQECLDELKSGADDIYPLNKQPAEIRARVFVCAACIELQYFNTTGRVADALPLLPAIKSELKFHLTELEDVMILELYYNIAILHFTAGDFGASLDWFNQLLNLKYINVRENMRSETEIMLLILHFEMGNYNLLEYQIKNTYRHLSKRKRLYGFEKLLMRFLRTELPKVNDHRKLLLAFARLKKDMDKLYSQPTEREALSYFDFSKWLQSKISGKPYAELL